jgi:predicted DCC family thiol-disulfide oxidoreductase YuxK
MDQSVKPILLFNDECGVCRHIARWVRKAARSAAGEALVVERPIGDNPDALRSLNPALDIWDAYATLHLLMPDGSMKLGGEAVAEVLRRVPSMRWFTWTLSLGVFGVRPFQALLDVAYAVLAHVRPLFGCESCGTPSSWMKPITAVARAARAVFGRSQRPPPTPYFSARPVRIPRPSTAGDRPS